MVTVAAGKSEQLLHGQEPGKRVCCELSVVFLVILVILPRAIGLKKKKKIVTDIKIRNG